MGELPERGTHIYRLLPDAPAYDPGWDLAPPLGEIIVRADSPAEARVIAANSEPDFPDFNALPGDGRETAFASAVRNPRLYRVERIDDPSYPDEGEKGLLRAASVAIPRV